MNLTTYVSQHWSDCRFDAEFSIKGYKKKLKTLIDKNSELQLAIEPILSKEKLSRKRVFEWINRSPYQGFLAAMLWGGISSVTTKKKMQSNLERAFSVNKQTIETILSKVSELLNEGKEGAAFDYLYCGEGKLDGIGISYLTKIMYFFSPDNAKECLIFDKWGRFMHAALISQDKNSDINNYYRFVYRADFKSELKSVIPEKELYLDYLNRIRNVAGSDDRIPSAGHLEAFLFGDKLYRNNKNNNNPRFFIYNLVERLYSTSNHKLSTVHSSNNTIVEITSKAEVMNRKAYMGYNIISADYNLYIIAGFIGKRRKKAFCDVLLKEGTFPKEKELMDIGLTKKNTKNPYFIKKFNSDKIDEACVLVEAIKDIVLY